jgi:hypothetical protein
MGKKVGFTGTSKGASPAQLAELEARLAKLKEEGFDEFHHGLCIGADEQAAIIAKKLGYRVIAHPGFSKKKPECLLYRSEFTGNDATLEAKPHIDRDHDIVDAVDHMLATPLQREEINRSGTWTTVRYARKQNRPLDVILPPFAPPQWAPPPVKTNAIAGEDPSSLIKRGVK